MRTSPSFLGAFVLCIVFMAVPRTHAQFLPELGIITGDDPFGYCKTEGIIAPGRAGTCGRGGRSFGGGFSDGSSRRDDGAFTTAGGSRRDDGAFTGVGGGSSVSLGSLGFSLPSSRGGNGDVRRGFDLPSFDASALRFPGRGGNGFDGVVDRLGGIGDRLFTRPGSSSSLDSGNRSGFGIDLRSVGDVARNARNNLGDATDGFADYIDQLLRDRSSGEQSSGIELSNTQSGGPFADYIARLQRHQSTVGNNTFDFSDTHDQRELNDANGRAAALEAYLAAELAKAQERRQRVLDGRDSDGDGLTDAVELRLGLDPLHSDTDGDGVPDGVEVGDPDNPRFTNSDGMIDALSMQNDSDGDGLTNADELRLGTDPNRADTDGDGVHDGQEVGDPLNPRRTGTRYIDALNAFNDSDDDGVPNLDEVRLGTDPLTPDAAEGDEQLIADTYTQRTQREYENIVLPQTGASRDAWFRPESIEHTKREKSWWSRLLSLM